MLRLGCDRDMQLSCCFCRVRFNSCVAEHSLALLRNVAKFIFRFDWWLVQLSLSISLYSLLFCLAAAGLSNRLTHRKILTNSIAFADWHSVGTISDRQPSRWQCLIHWDSEIHSFDSILFFPWRSLVLVHSTNQHRVPYSSIYRV